MDEGSIQEYLNRVFQMDPLEEAEEILEFRARFLGLPPPPDPPPIWWDQGYDALKFERFEIMDEIEEIRIQFWELDPKEVEERLGKLSPKYFPDLQASLEKLLLLAQHRSDLVDLFDSCQLDSFYREHIQQILCSQRAEGLKSKEKVSLRQTSAPTGHKKLLSRFIRSLKRDLNPLYNLEHQWFNTLL